MAKCLILTIFIKTEMSIWDICFVSGLPRNNDSYYDEIYQCCIERDIKIPKTAKIYALKLLFSSIKNKVKEL